jgi:hypothetical protein
LDLQLACAAKNAVPFEIVLSITWNTPNFDHTYLAIPKVESDDFFTKTKETGIWENLTFG